MRKKPIKTQEYREVILYWALGEKPKVVVEVGVYLAQLSKMLLTVPSVEAYTIVDSWKAPYMHFSQAHMDSIAKEVQFWAAGEPRVSVMRKDSLEAAALWPDESIDFWHTDGDHSYEGTKADILTWMPKVKSGCLMSGDNLEIPTVKQAISDAFPRYNVAGKGRIWWFRKP